MKDNIAIIFIFVVFGLVALLGFKACNNSIDNDPYMAGYYEYNSESFFSNLLGGDLKQKTVYKVFKKASAEQGSKVYEVAVSYRKAFANKERFETPTNLMFMPTIKGVSKTKFDKQEVVEILCETKTDNKVNTFIVIIPEN